LGLISFILFVGEFSDLGKGDYGIWQALLNILMQLPAQLVAFFPVVALLGAMLGLSTLASNHELVAIRACGYSILQIIWQIFKVFFLLVLLVFILGESLAPKLTEYASNEKGRYISQGKAISVGAGAWFREGNSFIFIERALTTKSLKGIFQYEFNEHNELIRALTASGASRDNENHWWLENVKETSFNEKTLTSTNVEKKKWQEEPPIYLLTRKRKELDQQGIASLYQLIQLKKSHHLNSTVEELIFWRRFMLPVTTVVMLLLALPFVFGGLRQSSIGAKLVAGVAIGFGYYMLNDLMVPLSMLYQLPPLMTVLTPPLLFLVLAIILIRKST
jgi:lipopolysaccharide export system permease protein